MKPSAGRIYTGSDIDEDITHECDVCVIGSGSGGAWTAYELSARGLNVVMLEEGGYHTRREFDLTEERAFANLYQDLGNRTTDDLSINILQGRSVGGGTTVNWTSSFRTPERILKHWAEVHGVEGLSREILNPHFDAIEERLSIAEWPEDRINQNNSVLWRGLGALGYSRGLIRRNVKGCANTGYCGMGCPIDAKQSMLVTLIPDAVQKGMTLFANARAENLEWSGSRIEKVRARIFDETTDQPTSRTLTILPKTTVVSCGAINSPALLLR